MSDRARPLDLLLQLLVREEAAMLALIQLAGREQAALVSSDYAAIELVANEMQTSASVLEVLEREREVLMEAIGAPGSSLADVAQLAARAGIPGVAETRSRLLAGAEALREAQERNARLILSAARLRERWFSLLAGLTSSTYGSEGRQELQQARRVVSKSA
jgi:nucleotide-binding universal stress UspA family protein